MALLVFSVSLALGVSALCSLLEATLLSYTTSQVSALQTKRPRVGKIWQRFKDHIEKPIAVILVTNTAAHTIGATIAGAQFEQIYGEEWLIVFSIVLTYLMLQFTEILPKTIGVKYNHLLAPAIAPPLDLLVRVMRPILWFIHLVNKPFERKSEIADTTLEEIAGLAASARLSQLIDPRQAEILHAASQIESLRVRQIMTPRVEIQYLRVGQPVEELLDILRNSPYTRLPLLRGRH
jgi:CBS domain containing-hemolysin-like protein